MQTLQVERQRHQNFEFLEMQFVWLAEHAGTRYDRPRPARPLERLAPGARMSHGTCSVCSAPAEVRLSVDDALQRKEKLRVIAKRCGFSKSALGRHKLHIRSSSQRRMFAPGDRLFVHYPDVIPGYENDTKAGGLFHWDTLKPASFADVREQDAIITVEYDKPGDHYGYIVETGPNAGRYLRSEQAHTAALDEKLQRERQAERQPEEPTPPVDTTAGDHAPVAEADQPSALQAEACAPSPTPAPALPQQPSLLKWLDSFRVH
jgi:hypothetical protein